jgi:iron complex outermembrane receptor protein
VLEEIVVTAQKREQNIQDVAISITALSGEQMSALGLDNTQEITQQVPGLQVQTFTPGFTVFNLRGVSQNNFQDNLEAPVAAYFDGVYIGSLNAIGGQIFDLERTEVLRGPQGTLFGRNATGGLLHFITKKADNDELNGYIRSEISEFNSFSLEGAVGGSLSDTVRGRFAGRWEQSDGYFKPGAIAPDALGPGSPEIQGTADSTIGADAISLRGSLQINISDTTTIDLGVSYSDDNDVPVGQYAVYLVGLDENGLGLAPEDFSRPLTGDVHRHAGSDVSVGGLDTGLDREILSATATLVTELSNGWELTSISNWFDMEKSHREDPGGGVIPFPFLTNADYQQWSQELRLSSEGDTYRWQVGAYYLDMDLDSRSALGGPFFGTTDTGFIDGFTDLKSSNWSVFGQVEVDVSDSLTIIAGLRWSQDDKDIKFQNVATSGVIGVPDGTILFDLATEAVGEFSGVPVIDYGDYAARLQANWQANDETLVFLSFNRGIKGGNWSTGASVTLDSFQHAEETLLAYELGIKTSFSDGFGRLNATLFHYDYQDYQAFSILNFVPQVTNVDASNTGGEIELTLFPNDHWDISLGLSLIDSKVDQSPGALPGVFIQNTDLPSAPGYSLNYLLRYNWDTLGGNMAVQLDGNYNDDQFLEGHNGATSLQESYATFNASISFTPNDGKWDVRAWVKNLSDAEWAIYSNDVGGFVIRQYAPPRQVGVTAAYHW